MDPVAAVTMLGGVARRRDVIGRGAARSAIDLAVESGSLHRPLRGMVALPTADPGLVRAKYFDARITCASAAKHHQLRLLEDPEVLHLEIPGERGGTCSSSPAWSGVCMHRTRTFEPGTAIVGVPRAIDLIGTCLGPRAQLVALDHALAKRAFRLEDVRSFTSTPLLQRRWLERLADAKSGSVPETCARLALRTAGLHVESQASIGDWRHADFLVEDALFVEIDGRDYHSDPRQFDEDRRRDRSIVAQRGHVIRFTYADAVHHPDRLVADVRAALHAIKEQGTMR